MEALNFLTTGNYFDISIGDTLEDIQKKIGDKNIFIGHESFDKSSTVMIDRWGTNICFSDNRINLITMKFSLADSKSFTIHLDKAMKLGDSLKSLDAFILFLNEKKLSWKFHTILEDYLFIKIIESDIEIQFDYSNKHLL